MNYYSLVSAILVAQRHFAFSVHRLMENRVLLGSQPLINNQVQQKKKALSVIFSRNSWIFKLYTSLTEFTGISSKT